MLKSAYLAACVVLFAASFSFVRCQQTLFIDDGVNFGQKPVLQLNTKYSEQLSSLAISDKVISVKTRLLAKYESDGSIDAGFNVSEKCINATENILLGVLGGEMWAMKSKCQRIGKLTLVTNKVKPLQSHILNVPNAHWNEKLLNTNT